MICADHIHNRAMDIAEAAAKVSVAAREAYAVANGYDDPQWDLDLFGEYGNVLDRERFESVARRFARD